MAHALPNGTLLYYNQYRIEKVLGQGGFGITYLAHDSSLDRKVAIKEFFPKEFCGREGETTIMTSGVSGHSDYVRKLKEKFLNEARHIGRLNHPNIIKIYTAFEENNTAYYVMEYIEGENLNEKVKRNGSLKEGEAVKYIEKVGEALEYMHKQKFNHLDVKPANIMVESSSDAPILIDFGLSTHYETGEDIPTGTMPPGISNGYSPLALYDSNRNRAFNPQHDVYSLAATLYFLVSGITPPNAVQLSSSILTFHSNFPESLKDPVKKGMAISTEERYPSVKKFIHKISPEKDPKPVFAANSIIKQILGNTDKEGFYLQLNDKKIGISLNSEDFFGISLLNYTIGLIVVLFFGVILLHGNEDLGDLKIPYRIAIYILELSSILWFFGFYNFIRLRKLGYYQIKIALIIQTILGFLILGYIIYFVFDIIFFDEKSKSEFLNLNLWGKIEYCFNMIGFLIMTFLLCWTPSQYLSRINKIWKNDKHIFNNFGSYIQVIIILVILVGFMVFSFLQ